MNAAREIYTGCILMYIQHVCRGISIYKTNEG